MNALTDPQVGDKVRAQSGRTRRVTARRGNNIWYVLEEQSLQEEKICWITTWTDWCKRNKATEPA